MSDPSERRCVCPLNRSINKMPRVASRLTDEIADEARASGREIIPVSAYPNRPLPDRILDEIAAASRDMRHAPARGLLELRRGVANLLRMETGVPIDPEREAFISQGAMHALHLILAAVLESGDEVLTFSPCYFFHGLVELSGARMIHVPLSRRSEYAFDMDRLEAAVGRRTRVLLVNTPVNPTGYVASPHDVVELLKFAERHGLLLVADESYDRLVYDGLRHHSFLRGFRSDGNVALVRAFTKSYGMPEWRVGYVIAPSPLIEQITKVFEWEMLFGCYLSQKAASIVLASGAPWLAGIEAEFQANRDLLLHHIQSIDGFAACPPGGNPFVFIDISKFGVCDEIASRRLLSEYGLPNTPGTAHGEPGCLRVPFGGPREAITRAVEALKALHGDLENGT